MNWRNGVIRGSILLMESIWTYAVVAFTVAAITDGGEPSFFGVLAVVMGSYAISRFLQNSDLSLGLIRVWGTLFSFLIFYAIVRVDFFDSWALWDFSWADAIFNNTEASFRDNVPAVFGIPMLWGFWARGVMRGQETNTFEDVATSFGVGVLIVAAVELFQGGLGDSPALVGRLAVPYVAIGLVALGLAHSGQSETDKGQTFPRTLAVALGVSVVGLALFAGVVALFDAATGWDAAQDAGAAVVEAGESASEVILWPVEQLLEGIFAVIIFFRDLILGTPPPPEQPPPQAQDGEDCLRFYIQEQGLTPEEADKRCNPKANELPQWVQSLVRVMIALPVIAIIVVMTALLFTRFRKNRPAGELKESAYQAGRLGSDLSNLLNNLMGRLRPNLHLGRDHPDEVRRLYHDLLEDAERHGVARSAHQTPNEFAPALETTYHGRAPSAITNAFDDARYGQRLADTEEVRRLRQEWDQLRRE